MGAISLAIARKQLIDAFHSIFVMFLTFTLKFKFYGNIYILCYTIIFVKSQTLMFRCMSLSTSMEMEKMVQMKEEVPMQELIPPSNICDMDVQEWAMEMRENNIVMDELNMQVKEEKIRDIEQIEYRERTSREEEIVGKEKDIDYREKFFNMREKEINEKKKEVSLRYQMLDIQELRIVEKSRIFEMLNQMNEFG